MVALALALNARGKVRPQMTSRFQMLHNDLCAKLKRQRITWEGPLSGKAPCEVCKVAVATQGHHLIITRAKMVGCPEGLKEHIARTGMNVILVCPKCHMDDIEVLRMALIATEVYSRYGESEVKAWVQDMEQEMRTKITLPGRLCRWCRHAYLKAGCPHYDPCDGRTHFIRVSNEDMQLRLRSS